MSKSNSKIQLYIENLQEIIESMPCRCNFRIDACNDFTLPADWGFKDRVSPNYHIAYIWSGRGSYMLGEREEKMDRGKIIFVSKDFCHSRILDPDNLPRIILVRFSILDNISLIPLAMNNEPYAFSFMVKDKMMFYFLFTSLARCYKNRSMKYASKLCGNILGQILLAMHNELYNEEFRTASGGSMEKASRYIEKNLEKDLPVEEIAAVCGLSKNYFRKCFKSYYGINPKQYHIGLKIEKAIQLLTETGHSIKDIAASLGYSDQYAFSKQFKMVTGKAPSEVKR